MAAMSIVFCVSWDCVKTKNTSLQFSAVAFTSFIALFVAALKSRLICKQIQTLDPEIPLHYSALRTKKSSMVPRYSHRLPSVGCL